MGSSWEAQVAALTGGNTRPRREPLSVARIVTTALALVAAEGYESLTTRRLAGALGVTPGALYAHVTDKAELDNLMIGELCSRVVVPRPDPGRWLEQVADVCRQLRDQYLAYPGVARASFDTTPDCVDAWRVYEGMLAILTAAGVRVRDAARAADAAFLYIGAFSVVSRRRPDDGDAGPGIADRFRMLPADRFPILSAHAAEVGDDVGSERFDATITLLFGSLVRPEGEGQ